MKHFAQVLSVDTLAKVALGALTIALIRFMPVKEYAALTFAVSVAGLAAQIFSAGVNRIYIVGFERYALGGRIEALLALQLAGIALLALLALPVAGAFRGLYPAAVVLAGAIMLSEFSKTYYQRELRFVRYSGIEVTRTLLQGAAIGGLLVIYRDRLEAVAVLWAQSVALALAFVAMFRPVVRWGRLVDLPSAGTLARGIAGGPYALLFVYFSVIAVFSQADVMMVRWLADDHVLASYGAALRYYGVLSLALSAVHAVLLPTIQQARASEELGALFGKHFRLVMIYIPLVAFAAAAAGWVMPWVDEGRYPDSVTAFRVLALSAAISFAFSPHVNLLMKLERFRFLVVLVVAALGVNLALLTMLVPRYGATGAAVAVLIAAACVTVPIYFESRRLRLGRA
jgi:O-antigen/teichoic acid export membrane protein